MYLTSLDCPSARFCLATGWYFASSSLDEVRSFDLAFSGASWRAQTIHMQRLDPGIGSFDALPQAASCQGPDHCVVVGSYYDASGNEHGLIETLGRGRWEAASAPVAGLRLAAGADAGFGLDAVSCPPGTTCVAVGTYRDAAGTVHGMIERGPG